tara:strand:- start:2685 stop:3557 length:873 start_codon:yes stop_codon:yes gene_type:complete
MPGKCDKCLNNLEIGLYQYINDSYCITTTNNDIVRSVFQDPDITNTGTKDNIKYCTNTDCNNYFNYPIAYKDINNNNKSIVKKETPPVCSGCFIINDVGATECTNCGISIVPEEEDISISVINKEYRFTINDLDETINFYQNFICDNIIHNFTNIECKHCKTILKKGYIRINEIVDTENNIFNETIYICEEDTDDIVKTLKLEDINFNFKFKALTSRISKNLLYCSSCFYGIFNNLKDMDVNLQEENDVVTVGWEEEVKVYPLVCSECLLINEPGINVCVHCDGELTPQI